MITEDTIPVPGLPQQSAPQIEVYRERTRRHLAWAMIGLLATVIVVGAIGWLRFGDDTARMQGYAVIFSPVSTLLGTILGYYFLTEKG